MEMAKKFASARACCSEIDNVLLGRPYGEDGDLICLGPFLKPRARENVEHGGPAMMAS